ncbi:recombinase [Lachnospiraceae bacterium MD329]|nr:recombinase [Lachnospiraceae bacterium MD329]
MANNSLQQQQPQEQKHKFSVMIQGDTYKNLINRTLNDSERAKRFVAAISSAVAINPMLQDCDAGSILSAGLLGESLNLSPSPQLGEYYLVPFNVKTNRVGPDGKPIYVKKAQFQIGYKGYMKLAINSGQIRKMNVVVVKEGENVRYNPYDETFEATYIEDYNKRENTPTIGYYAMFETINGYRKIMYWSKEKMEAHALKYSQGYRAKKGYTFWEKDFDAMACKTMLRQIISKGGCPMSTEMQTGLESDMAMINKDGTYSYVDNAPDEPVITQNDPDESILAEGEYDEPVAKSQPEESGEINLDDV